MGALKTGVSRILNFNELRSRILGLLRAPMFWMLTVWGNVCILGGAYLMERLEGDVNPGATDFLDCVIWAVGVVTTVGSSGIVPMTTGGKVLQIIMMMGGAVFLWSYMAIFIGALVEPDLQSLEREVSSLQQEVHEEEELLGRLRELLAKRRERKL